jgi:small subunit ribosomal protein S1
VRHPSEVLSVGDELTAKILKFDQEKNRVSLGLKQLGEDPWVGISRRYPQGTRLFGKVTNITDYGAFVEIEGHRRPGARPKWTGPTRTSPRPRLSSWATKSKSWSSRSTKTVVVSPGHEAVQGQSVGRFRRNHKKGDKVPARSSRSPTSACSSAWLAASTAWCTCPTCRGETGEEAVRKYKKGDEVEASCWHRRREGAHLARHQAARRRSVHQLHRHERQGFARDGTSRRWMPGRRDAADDDVEGYLRASEISATAWKTPATC